MPISTICGTFLTESYYASAYLLLEFNKVTRSVAFSGIVTIIIIIIIIRANYPSNDSTELPYPTTEMVVIMK